MRVPPRRRAPGARLVSVVLGLALGACGGEDKPPPTVFARDSGPADAGLWPDAAVEPDAGLPSDAGPPVDAGLPDARVDAGPRPDGGPPVDGGSGRPDLGALEPGPSVASPPAVVEQPGMGGLLLVGTVLGEDAVFDGEVLIVDDTIACVDVSCRAHPAAGSATVVQTWGVISPGLIDAHNHLTYDFLPEWVAPSLYDNRYQWSDVPSYEAHVAPFADGRNSNDRICPAAKWGELRSLIHGTTTVMGQSPNRSCLDRLVRNADHHHGLGYDHMRTTIGSPRDLTDDDAAGLVMDFTASSNPVTRFALHMGEGIRGDGVDLEFASYAGRDPRPNRHQGVNLLVDPGRYSGTGLLIHGVTLTDAEITEAAAAGAHVVWSPSSNMVLYGQTAAVDRMIAAGINLAIGPDWTVSGTDELLSELRFARQLADDLAFMGVDDERLWRMATHGGADAVGLGFAIGRLRPGYVADIVVFGRRAFAPHRAVVESRAADVRLVLIGGVAYYGDESLRQDAPTLGRCETFDACGAAKFLCVADTPGASGDDRSGEGVAEIESQLRTLLDGYGRASELVPLVACE